MYVCNYVCMCLYVCTGWILTNHGCPFEADFFFELVGFFINRDRLYVCMYVCV